MTNFAQKNGLHTQAKKVCAKEHQSMNGCFEALKNKYGNVLLIDDVLTTGSTADVCASELKAAGAERVYVLTLAGGQCQAYVIKEYILFFF